MRRRDFLAGAAAATVFGGGAAVTLADVDVTTLGTEEDGPELRATTVETIDARGSEAGEITVPVQDRITFVEFFATWCSVCAKTVPNTATVYEEYGDQVAFVSITIEPVGRTTTREDVAEWWADHDGQWTVGLDEDVSQEFGVVGVPHAAVVDASNELVWSEKGFKTADEMRKPIETALADAE